MRTVVSDVGSVPIPEEIRRRHNIKPGDEVEVVDYAGVITIVRANIPEHGRGMIEDTGLLAAHLEEKQRESERQYEHDTARGAGNDA